MGGFGKTMALGMCVAILFSFSYVAAEKPPASSDANSALTVNCEYDAYLKNNSAENIRQDILLSYENVLSGDFELQGDDILLNEGDYADFVFLNEEAVSATIEITYISADNKINDPEISLAVNGEIPFDEMSRISLEQIWENDKSEMTKEGYLSDNVGNQIAPTQVKADIFNTKILSSFSASQIMPYKFLFSKGSTTITVKCIRNSIKIKNIRIFSAETVNTVSSSGGKNYSGKPIIIEGESALYKSSSVLMPKTDKSTPATSPSSPYAGLINTIGGSSWNTAGQWIEWHIEVQSAGYYSIGFKFRQNTVSGMFSTRSLTVNGQSPHANAKQIEFGYDSAWQALVLTDSEKNHAKIHLKKGTNVLRLTATLGSAAELYSIGAESVSELNKAYRDIIMYTSTAPDPLRNYKIDKNCPEAMKIIKKEAENLKLISKGIADISGAKGDINTVIDNLCLQLESFCESPITIPSRIDSFRSNITSFADTIYRLAQQPLEIDYIALFSPEAQENNGLKNIKAGFFESLLYEIKAFLYSFVSGYESDTSAKNEIAVWTTGGRDQATILKRLIDMQFTKSNDILVNLKMVSASSGVSTLLLATVSGMGPDAAIGLANSDAVNYAIRDTACSLSDFEGFEKITERFGNGAMTPYYYNGKYYALPLTQSFAVMFYRTDLFEELKLSVPEDWLELYYTVSRLQKNNMTAGIPSDLNYLVTHIYQNGGKLYSDDGKTALLDSRISTEAFKDWCNLYTSYNLPIDYDAANRFRTGEMPLLIADYTIYNTISLLAPEIREYIGMALIPGTKKPNGTIDRSVTSSGSCAIILSTSKKRDEAFKFLDWLTSDSAQSSYARNLESRLGIAARVQTANKNVIEDLTWSKAECAVLKEQWSSAIGIPEVPGSYYVARSVNNALRNVVSYRNDPQEILKEYTETVNDEIAKKRSQYNLD